MTQMTGSRSKHANLDADAYCVYQIHGDVNLDGAFALSII